MSAIGTQPAGRRRTARVSADGAPSVGARQAASTTDAASRAGAVRQGLGAVPCDEWDGLVGPGDAALRHGYLTAWEQAELQGLRSLPVLARRAGDGRLVAACPGYLYDLDMAGVRSPRMAAVLAVLRRLWPRLLFARTYELGSPSPLTNPFLCLDEVSRRQQTAVLIDAAVREAHEAGAALVLVQNFTSLQTPAAVTLRSLGFAGIPMLPSAVVDLRFSSFEDYLSSMRSQYRRRARQTLRRSEELHVEHLHSFAEFAEELARLWRLIYDRASEIRREILTAEFFRAAAAVEQLSVLLLRRRDGSIASFALLLDDAPMLSFLQCGFAAEDARDQGAYFRLLYELIRLGIEGGYEQLDLGVTTLTAKLDVGAVPVPLFAWLRHRSPVVQRVMVGLANGPLSQRMPEQRHVFRDGCASASELVARRKLAV
jgi:predicted N-acyltransferase